jgi:hypothetical protein
VRSVKRAGVALFALGTASLAASMFHFRRTLDLLERDGLALGEELCDFFAPTVVGLGIILLAACRITSIVGQ